MTNFATILNSLFYGSENRNEYIVRLCSYPLLILDDFGMERGTELLWYTKIVTLSSDKTS